MLSEYFEGILMGTDPFPAKCQILNTFVIMSDVIKSFDCITIRKSAWVGFLYYSIKRLNCLGQHMAFWYLSHMRKNLH